MASNTSSTLQWWAGVVTLVLGMLVIGLAWHGLGPHRGGLAAGAEQLTRAVGVLTLRTVTRDSVVVADPDAARQMTLGLARILALLSASSAVIALLASLSPTFRDFVKRQWIVAWSYLRPGHAVIIGLSDMGLQLARDLRHNRRHVIVLEPDEDVPAVDEARRLGALVLIGDAREQAVRQRAHLNLAREVFITCNDDALNVDIAGDLLQNFRSGTLKRSRRVLSQREQRYRHLQCYVHVGEPGFSEALRAHDLLGGKEEKIDFHIFNVRANAARQLLLDPEHGLARAYAPSEDEVAHYILFGFGEMGQTVALHMARLAHFKNLRRLRLTIVDDFGGDAQIRKAQQCFRDRHPGFCPDLSFKLDDHVSLDDPDMDNWSYRDARPDHKDWRFADSDVVEYAVNAEFLDMPTEVDAPGLMGRLGERLRREQRPAIRAAVVVCFDDDRQNFEAALRVREALRQLPEERLPKSPLPTYAFLQDEEGLSSLVRSQSTATGPFRLHAFGQIDQSAGYRHVVQPTIRTMAGWFHVAYEELQGGRAGGIVDPAAVHAALLPAYRQSNEDAAAHAYVKLDAIGCRAQELNGEEALKEAITPDRRELLSHIEHNRWMAERLVTGWRHGPRDDRRKRRLAFHTWENLPESNKAKDESQINVLVRAFQRAGMAVECNLGQSVPLSGALEATATPPATVDAQRPGSASSG